MTERPEQPDIWGLSDSDFGAIAQSKLRMVSGKGKADIGGRMRVASILRKIGIQAPTPERIAGSTNEVWRAGDLIIRVGTTAGTTRLRREAEVVKSLPWGSTYPKVVATGEEPFGEWLVVQHCRGTVLSDAWNTMDRNARRSATRKLANMVRDIHQSIRQNDQQGRHDNPFTDIAFDNASRELLPYELSAAALTAMLEKFAMMPAVDQKLVEDLMDRVASLAGAFDDRSNEVLLHGDLHFENVLVDNGEIVCILDFEWSRRGPVELDLDVLARFCLHPDLTVGAATKSQRDSYRPVLGWFNEAYPEMFESPALDDRLMYASLAAEIPWLLRMPPDAPAVQLAPFHPVNRVKELLSAGSAAHRLGWIPSGI